MANGDNNQWQQAKELAELKESLKQWDFSDKSTLTPYEDSITLSSNYGYDYANVSIGNGGTAITGGISAATGVYSIGGGIGSPWASVSNTHSTKIKLEGEDADIEINGTSLMKLLQERLNVLVPNPEIEAEWEELKRLGDQYRAVEADIKEKMRMWNKLKSSSRVDVSDW